MVSHEPLGPVPSFLEFTICILFSLLECFNRNEVRDLEGFTFFAFIAEDHISEARYQVVWHWFKACNRRVLRKSAASFLIPHLAHLPSRSSLLVQRFQWHHLCQSKTDLSHSIPKSPVCGLLPSCTSLCYTMSGQSDVQLLVLVSESQSKTRLTT